MSKDGLGLHKCYIKFEYDTKQYRPEGVAIDMDKRLMHESKIRLAIRYIDMTG